MRIRTSDKRDSIVAAAAAVFQEHGFDRASMSEIAARVGGSKATLYGYFQSKEELFVAVTQAAAEAQFGSIENELNASHDIGEALRWFGFKFLSFTLQPNVVAAHRMVLAVSGNSDIGRSFYTRGPREGLKIMASFFEQAMDKGDLKRADAWVMAQQLIALLQAELGPDYLYGMQWQLPQDSIINVTVARAVEVFMTAYAAVAPVAHLSERKRAAKPYRV